METKAIRLTVFRQADTYIFALELPSQASDARQAPASWSVGGMTTLSADVRGQLNETINALVERLRKERGNAAAFLRLGQFLFNFLLPPALQEVLRDLPEQGIPIILTSNDTELPWELLHDGSQYLSLKHPIARRLWSSAPVRGKDSPPSSRSFLLIANPTEDLDQADEESEVLMDLFEQELINGGSLKVLARQRADWLRVSQALGGSHEIIHYSGHAERGVLLLHDRELTTEDIQRTLQGHPFVFLNACWSSREATQVKGAEALDYAGVTIRNLAQAFILGGSAGFIGTLWPVFDHSSRQFAAQFYTHVLEGVAVGEALRRTRVQMREQKPDDPIWASFVHYGNPMLTLAKAPPEKRYVTVLVAKLAGLALSVEELALEAAAQLKEQVLKELKGIVERYGGWFTGPVTDVLAVYFGIPLMTGNEAEVAIRAARDMSQAVGGNALRLPQLRLQIGISTGYVLYRASQGDGRGHSLALAPTGILEEMAAVGATQAKNGQIVVDQATYQSARTTFSFEPVESAASPRYRVIGHQLPTRSEFVGREEELSQLQGFWRKARAGRRQVICIGGQPGVGKSRLLEAFRKQITSEQPSPLTPRKRIPLRVPQGDAPANLLWIRAICHSYDKSQSYHLLGQVIRALAQIEPHDDEASQRHKLGQLVEGEDELALLSTVLGLPFEMPAIQNLTQELAQKLLKKLLEKILKRQAASQPIVLALEDLQSADEDSLTVLEQLVKGRSKRMPLLLLAVYRLDEWEHNWGNAVQTNIELDELPRCAQLTMLTNLLDLPPSEELAQTLLKQTGGNPLFIEEYIRFLQESGSLTRSGDSWTANLSDIPLLNKVEAVIQARLGRLEEQSRHTLHSAAIIGQTFEDQVLYKVRESRRDQSDEEEIIEELSHQRLIEELEEGHNNIFFYAFRHGLVHQIASTLFPDSLLQTMHRLVAQALQVVYRDEEKILSRLAHHYYHSHDRINAIRYSLRAAKSDAQRWANQGAVLWYGRVLEKIGTFESEPLSQAEQQQGITASQLMIWQMKALAGQAEIQVTIGQIKQAITSYKQALALITAENVVTYRADLYRQLAIAYQHLGQFDRAQEVVNKGLALLKTTSPLSEQDTTLLGQLHVYTGFLHYRRGTLVDGLAACEQGIAILQSTESIRDLAQAYNLQGIFYRNLGKQQKALKAYEQSITLYKEAEYLPGQGWASSNKGLLYQDLGKWEAALSAFQESSALSQRTSEIRRQATALNNQGEIYRRQGKLEQAITAYEQARQILEELGSEEFIGIALMNLGASYLKQGTLSEATTHLETSLELFQRLQANVHLPELLRYLAELELLKGEAAKAQQLAQEAVEWALKLERRVEKGQARRCLGQALRDLGQFEEAQKQLDESLTILEENNNPYEIGLTLVELARLRQAQHEADNHEAWREQAIGYCKRALTIFKQLGAALDLARTEQIHQSIGGNNVYPTP